MVGLLIKSFLGSVLDEGWEWFGDDNDHFTKYRVINRIYSTQNTLPISPLYLCYLKDCVIPNGIHTEWADHGRYGERDPSEITLDRTDSVVYYLNSMLGDEIFTNDPKCEIDITDYINETDIIDVSNMTVQELVEKHICYPNERFPFSKNNLRKGEYPIDCAIRENNGRLLHLLIRQGAYIFSKPWGGDTSSVLKFVLETSEDSMRDYYLLKCIYPVDSTSIWYRHLILLEYVKAIKLGYQKIVLRLFVKYNHIIQNAILSRNNPYIENFFSKDPNMRYLVEKYVWKKCAKELSDAERNEIEDYIWTLKPEITDQWPFCQI